MRVRVTGSIGFAGKERFSALLRINGGIRDDDPLRSAPDQRWLGCTGPVGILVRSRDDRLAYVVVYIFGGIGSTKVVLLLRAGAGRRLWPRLVQ